MKRIENLGKRLLKRNTRLRMMVRKIVVRLKRRRYEKRSNRLQLKDNLIIFESFMGRQYACNPKAIHEEMLRDKRFDDFQFIWAFTELERAKKLGLERTKIVEYGSTEYHVAMAAAKYVITNSALDLRITPKKGQVFIQTWHGTPLKKLRCDIETDEGNPQSSIKEARWMNDLDMVRYERILSPSAFTTKRFVSAFNLDNLGKCDAIIEEGYPRNDFLFNYTEDDVTCAKAKLGIENTDKKIILYAPTFRDNQHEGPKGFVYESPVDFDKLRDAMEKDYIILFRPHYFVANQFDFEQYKGFIYNVADIDDINELYIITDILITDYSSVFFDFANLKRPIIFYMYDLEEYKERIRGFYFSIDELPGEIVETEDQLINLIRMSDFSFDKRYQDFNKKFNYLENGNASKHVVDSIFFGKAI